MEIDTASLELVPTEEELMRAEFERVLNLEPAIPSAIARSIAWFAPPWSSVHAQVEADEGRS